MKSLAAQDAAWAARSLGATPTEILVAVAIARFANSAMVAYPGRATLIAQTGLSEVTIKRAIARLKELGVLAVVGLGGGKRNLTGYRFTPVNAGSSGSTVIPLRAREGGRSDTPSHDARGISEDRLGYQRGTTVTYKNLRHAGAREADPAALTDLRAERLAAAVRRKGDAALVLAEWRGPDVARIAIERHGIDPALLRELGCDVPLDLRRVADG